MSNSKLGLEILEYLDSIRESSPGNGRSAREILLDDAFHNCLDRSIVIKIGEDVAKLFKVEMVSKDE